MKKTAILLTCSLLATLNLNAASKVYTMEEIYNSMCIECHSADGSGNTEKLTPTMIGQNQAEILQALKDIEADKGHIIMEHNRGEILKMGMQYSAQDMAAYMFDKFQTGH